MRARCAPWALSTLVRRSAHRAAAFRVRRTPVFARLALQPGSLCRAPSHCRREAASASCFLRSTDRLHAFVPRRAAAQAPHGGRFPHASAAEQRRSHDASGHARLLLVPVHARGASASECDLRVPLLTRCAAAPASRSQNNVYVLVLTQGNTNAAAAFRFMQQARGAR